jgi:hypothetical protein
LILNDDFCSYLEFYLSGTFCNSKDDALKGYWCDGIHKTEPDNCYTKKFINDKRQTKFKADLGVSGQEEYEMIIHFGKKALSRIARDLDIKDCLPSNELSDWYKIDIDNKTIEIQLD